MMSAVNAAHDPSRSDVPPPPTVLPPRAPWLGNLMSNVCLMCSKEFGVFNWRHHCRACGGLFCDRCSQRKVKGIAGYEPTKECRVCDICFYHDIAIVVAWNQMLSGWHHEFYSDYVEASKKYLNDIPGYSSRVVMKVGTGFVYESYFKNDHWKQRVMDYAYKQVRKVLRPRIPLLWHNNPQQQQEPISLAPSMLHHQHNPNYYPPGSLPPPMYAPQEPLVVQQPQQYAPQPAPSVYQQQPAVMLPSAPPSIASPRELDETQRSVVVVYRQSDGEATDHAWLYFPRVRALEVIEEAGRFLRTIPRLSYGGVVDIAGTVHHFEKTSEASGSPAAFTQMFKTYIENMSVMMAVMESGDFKCTFFTKLRPAIDVVEACSESCVLLDMAGNIVISRKCSSQSWLDGLAKRAGAELLKQQQFCALLACGPGQVAHVFEDMYTARLFMARSSGFALFAIPAAGGSATPVLLQRHVYLSREEALNFSSTAAEKTKSLVSKQRIVVPEVESSESNRLVAKAPECGICFLSYDVDEHKPCLCSKCGNSLCYTCIRSVSLCPFCRKEMPVSGPWITNVQLLQLLSGVTD